MKNEEKIYLSKEGYEQYLKELEELKQSLTNNSKKKSSAYIGAVGDGWHDNFEFEDAKREEFKIISAIRDKVQGLSRIIIVEDSLDENVINIGDYVKVYTKYSVDDEEEEIYKLIATTTPDLSSDIKEISINSPLGKAIYKKSVGDSGFYSVNGNNIEYKIISKINQLDQDNSIKKGR